MQAQDARAKEAAEKTALRRLSSLPVTTWQQTTATRSDVDCALCMEPFGKSDVVRTLPCSHYFHEACVDHWFAVVKYQTRTCPLCKAEPLKLMDEMELATSPMPQLPDLRICK